LRREADELAERILPALFYKMFGDPVRNERGWDMAPLGSLCVVGPQYGANAKGINWRPSLPRYIRITDIKDDGSLADEDVKSLELEDWGEFVLEVGDIVFARSGATVGKAYMHRETAGQCVFAGYLIRFRADRKKLNPWTLFGLTRTPYYTNWVSSKKRTAAQPNINGQEYSSLTFPVPPVDLQDEFANRADELMALQGRQGESRQKMEKTFRSLLHRAFTGELTARWREKNAMQTGV
jgi:type I restriction enzyme S subunit